MGCSEIPKIYEVVSSGSVKIFYTTTGGKKEEEHRFAFQIQHGWQPLLFSTAACFARIICQSSAPVVIQKSVMAVIHGKGVKIYMPTTCKLKKEEGARVVEQQNQSDEEVPLLGVVNIFAADLKKFQERTEAWISDGMVVYCEVGGMVTCLSDSESSVFYGQLVGGDFCQKSERETPKDQGKA